MTDCERSVTALVISLAKLNLSLIAKSSELKHRPDVASALYELEIEAWDASTPGASSPGVMINGYVEATSKDAPLRGLWSVTLTRSVGLHWEIQRRLEVTKNNHWELARELSLQTFHDSEELAKSLPVLVDELLALPLTLMTSWCD